MVNVLWRLPCQITPHPDKPDWFVLKVKSDVDIVPFLAKVCLDRIPTHYGKVSSSTGVTTIECSRVGVRSIVEWITSK